MGVSWVSPGWRDDIKECTSQVGVSWVSPGWRDETKEWTSGSVVGITRMAG